MSLGEVGRVEESFEQVLESLGEFGRGLDKFGRVWESALAFSNLSKRNWAQEGLWQASQRHNLRAGFKRSR